VFRVGASSVSIASLSNKAADDTAHADGAIRAVGGNLYTVDLPDAACATQCPSICVRGSYTGGVIEGLEHPIVAYDPAQVAVGANTTTPPTAATVADAVWDEATVDHTSTGSTGAALSLILTAVNTLTSRIPATLFSGITYLSRWLGAIAGKTADAATRTEINATTGGASYNETTDSLEAIRDRGDAAWVTVQGTSIMVTPVVAQVPVRVRDTDIETYIGDLSTIRIGIFSGEDAVDLSGFGDLEVCVQAKDGTDLDFVEMADLTIDGTSNNYVSWEPSGPSVATIRRGKWSLRKSSNKQVIAKGAWIISDAALEDTGS